GRRHRPGGRARVLPSQARRRGAPRPPGWRAHARGLHLGARRGGIRGRVRRSAGPRELRARSGAAAGRTEGAVVSDRDRMASPAVAEATRAGSAPSLGVVIPCYRQERFLPRTVAALEQALAGRTWRGVLVLAAPSAEGATLPPLSAHWQVIAPPV